MNSLNAKSQLCILRVLVHDRRSVNVAGAVDIYAERMLTALFLELAAPAPKKWLGCEPHCAGGSVPPKTSKHHAPREMTRQVASEHHQHHPPRSVTAASRATSHRKGPAHQLAEEVDASPDRVINATIAVARLRSNGTLVIPPGTTEILIEVGANSRNTADQELLPKRPTAYLLTFEPILDKYGALLSRNSKPDAKTPLGHHHPRGIVFPMAVSSEEGFATLHMDGRLDGCASLLASKEARFSAECASTNALLQERHVDAASHTRVGTPSEGLMGRPQRR